MSRKRNPWDDTFWMAHPAWYPKEGKPLNDRISATFVYMLVAMGGFLIGIMVGYALWGA